MCKIEDREDPRPYYFYSISEPVEVEEEEEEESESDGEFVADLEPGHQLNPLTLEMSLEKFEESIWNAIEYVKDTEGLGRSCADLLEYVESIYECFYKIDKRWKEVGDSKGFSLQPSTLGELTFDELQSFTLDLLKKEVDDYYNALCDFVKPFPLSPDREKELEKLRRAINHHGIQLGPASYETTEPDEDE
ncbi:hypothetical protein AtNW77_Chr3g0204621 [Arabidopsis thaliana]|nr:uncharacterized protein AT3G49770 [Arabidopsis thaliana]KAG7627921.1 hypothetical protein ISN45_At03g042210 [Arabidopsis thaliana x Arabidopsis arenosa]KAG7633847.1 hypothetical protein ISN44_As03g041200 [Arabidopsis suecica]AAV68861.1 hypothetical protein AT3G49770 [Arabidopsis thaliana]AAX55176.1 hypothetical protein At3g49770 [Arabidopsis thaliana]AEE78588.1 hypothetical protein AT3G49770 [Arabidopsis thaliana]|eukprot:NP_190546.2 hypothetical protein AT3G49770 [Arabidopsis thaliana]